MIAINRIPVLALVLMLAATLHAPSVRATSDAQELVDKARITAEKMLKHPDTKPMRHLVRKAKGVLIIPSLLKAGFVIGGEGGRGVLLARNSRNGWSPPAFCTIGSGSLGLQIGFQDSEVMLLIMSDGALEAILSSKVKLGADASVAAGPVGLGVEGSTTTNLGADIMAYALTRGAYVGASMEGSVVVEDDRLNKGYYGRNATARAIVKERRFSNPAAARLIRVLHDG